MKLSVVLCLCFCLQVAARGISQTVTLSLENVRIQAVFKEIIRQANISILYEEQIFKDLPPFSIHVVNARIKDVLDKCIRQDEFQYIISGQSIYIDRKPQQAMSFFKEDTLRKVSGTVTNDTGDPLENVSVVVKGRNSGTVTDFSGSFSLNVGEGAILQFSLVDHESTEIKVDQRSDYTVMLPLQFNSLNEAVVTGYSTEKRKDITGSVSVVNMKAMQSIPTGSGEQALQGMASGVNVISSGAPGGGVNIFVRGISSFGNSHPLIIVDGVPASIQDISTNDIESIQVLKDAGAASIYGVRGSNGVVVVTTKKGKSGAPKITYDSYFGVQTPLQGNVFNLLNSADYAELVKKINPGTGLFANGLPDYLYAGPGVAGTAMEGDPAVDPSKYYFDPARPETHYLIQKVNKEGTDWFHEIFRNAPMQSHSLSASGGTDKSNYLLSVNYFNQQGTLIETYLKRYSVKINTQFKIGKHIRVGENIYVYYKQSPGFGNQTDGNAIGYAYRNMPIIPVYDIGGNYGGTWAGPELGNGGNPVAMQKNTRGNINNYWSTIGNLYAEVDIAKNLTARTSFGGTLGHSHTSSFRHNAYFEKQFHMAENGYNERSSYGSSWTWTNTLTYDNSFKLHHIKVLLGTEAINSYGRSVGGGSNNFFLTHPSYRILSNGTSNVTNFSSAYSRSLYSAFGRLDYAFDDRYLFSTTVRRDGSSSFGSEKRYGIFPSFSAAWRLSGEQFMQNIHVLHDLKLRASWGKLGSQNNIGDNNAHNLYNSSFQNSYYDINGLSTNPLQGFFAYQFGNPHTGWEEDIITNIGVDASLFANKLDVSIEWYKKEINGLLFTQPLPYTVGGADAPVVNIGDIRNKGWDFSVGHSGKLNRDFSYRINANLTTYQNVVGYIPGDYFEAGGSWFGNLVRNRTGYPVSSFFGYEVERLFQDHADVAASPTQTAAAPGRFKYRDVNGDGEITPDDRTFFGNPNPDFTYGITLSATYRSFDFQAVFYGSQGNDVLNGTRWFTDFYGSFVGAKSNDLLYNSWTPDRPNAKLPIAEAGSSFSTSGVPNSYYMEDGSFFKCRSIVLGYTIDPSMLRKIGIKKLRVYTQAANPFIITKYRGLDPELSGSSQAFGIDMGNYPNNQRNFLVGLNVSF